MKTGLKVKFMVPILALVIICLGIGSVMIFTTSRNALKRTVNEQLVSAAEATGQLLNNWLEDTRRNVEGWAGDYDVRSFLLYPGNREVMQNTVNARLREIKSKYPYLEAVNVVSLDGEVVASSDPEIVDKLSIADRSYFQESLKGRVIVSDAMKSGLTGEPVFIIAAPVKSGPEAYGVILGMVRLFALSEKFIDPVSVGKGGYAYLCDREGLTLAHRDKDAVLSRSISDTDFFQQMHGMTKGSIEYGFEGTSYMVAFARNETTGWYLGVVAHQDEIYAPVRYLAIISLVTALIITVLLVCVIAFLTNRHIIHPIRLVSERLKVAAQGKGDLSLRLDITSRDEVGELAYWFNAFIDNLEKIISRVKETAETVDTGTQEVSRGVQDLSHITQEQATAIEEVAATVEEMTSTIKENAANANMGREKTQEMVSVANHSGRVSKDLARAMEEVTNVSRKIGDIVVTVNEVAFQTNLLALNAAVEAARAGDHGKGFAVVAGEVRALAQRSAESSRQIEDLVRDTVAKIGAGDDMVKKTGNSLDQIIEMIQQLSHTMEDIAASSGEQARGIDELNRALSSIDTTTQRNASTAEELTSTSERLNIEAGELASVVSRFKVSDGLVRGAALGPAVTQYKQKLAEVDPGKAGLQEGFE